MDAGLTLYFKNSRDSDEFLQGDVYSFHAPEAFSVTASKNCEANLVVSGHPVKDHEYLVRILSSVGPGISRLTVESGNGKETGVTAVTVLGSRKEKESSYRLQSYRWRKDEKEYGE